MLYTLQNKYFIYNSKILFHYTLYNLELEYIFYHKKFLFLKRQVVLKFKKYNYFSYDVFVMSIFIMKYLIKTLATFHAIILHVEVEHIYLC